MTLIDYIVLTAVAAAVIFIAVYLVRAKKRRKAGSACTGCCSACGLSCGAAFSNSGSPLKVRGGKAVVDNNVEVK